MSRTHKQKQWTGALTSIVLTAIIFWSLDLLFGHFVSAVTVILLNIAFAASYKSENAYIQGARWATFFNMSWISYARHSYWYVIMLDSFKRMQQFDFPMDWNKELCRGDTEAILIMVTTSSLLIIFYILTTRWTEWTERWSSVRTSLLSASLGLQAIIVTAVVFPTPATLILALFFASVISPILRRQVRINHIVFLMLVPMFSLASKEVSLVAALVSGYFFFYFVSVERALSKPLASFSFFNGAVFSALGLSLIQDSVLNSFSPLASGVFSILCYVLTLAIAYGLIFRGDSMLEKLRLAQMRLTPAFIRESKWWTVRDLWVDREADHKNRKLYRLHKPKYDVGTMMFGPRFWTPDSETFVNVHFPKLNFTPSILALAIYSLWFGVDAVLQLTDGSLLQTVGGFILSFLFVILVPIILIARQFHNKKDFALPSRVASGFCILILGFYMASILFSGLTSSEALSNAAKSLDSGATPAGFPDSPKDFCTCQK